MRVGVVLLPQPRWHGPDGAAQRWRLVEELGFDHAWTYDHLSWRLLVEEPWFATVPVLAAAALTTTAIRLGASGSTPQSSVRSRSHRGRASTAWRSSLNCSTSS